MNTVWYKTPADDWNSALPVGNGRLGAMVYGGSGHETIQLNEESVWSGGHKDRNNRSCPHMVYKIPFNTASVRHLHCILIIIDDFSLGNKSPVYTLYFIHFSHPHKIVPRG